MFGFGSIWQVAYNGSKPSLNLFGYVSIPNNKFAYMEVKITVSSPGVSKPVCLVVTYHIFLDYPVGFFFFPVDVQTGWHPLNLFFIMDIVERRLYRS